jgi:hypothetical protein
LTALPCALLVASSGAALAADPSGCATLASTRVTLQQGTGAAHQTGAVPLRAGETIRFRMSGTGEAASGAVSVIESGETGDLLIAGSPPQEGRFAVPYDGLYGFEFRAEGTAPVAFEIVCQDNTVALAPSAQPQAFVSRRAAQILADDNSNTSLRRRRDRPSSLDKAIKRSTVLDEEGQPAEVSVLTTLQGLATAEGQTFADKKLDLWVQGSVSQGERRLQDEALHYDAEALAGTLQVGTDYLITPGLMIGALVQLDQYRESYDALDTATDSQGVLFGPYASVDMGSGLLFDARAAWGDSQNETTLPDGTQLSFATERQLVRGEISGNRNLLGLQLTPSVALSVVEDRIGAGRDAFDTDQTADGALFGRLGLGSTLSYRVGLDDGGYVQPTAGLSTAWNLDTLDSFSFEGADFVNHSGAKAEAGLALGTSDGVSFNALGAIEGIGENDYSAWSGRLSVTAPLN